jgi:hypothetical protein
MFDFLTISEGEYVYPDRAVTSDQWRSQLGVVKKKLLLTFNLFSFKLNEGYLFVDALCEESYRERPHISTSYIHM